MGGVETFLVDLEARLCEIEGVLGVIVGREVFHPIDGVCEFCVVREVLPGICFIGMGEIVGAGVEGHEGVVGGDG